MSKKSKNGEKYIYEVDSNTLDVLFLCLVQVTFKDISKLDTLIAVLGKVKAFGKMKKLKKCKACGVESGTEMWKFETGEIKVDKNGKAFIKDVIEMAISQGLLTGLGVSRINNLYKQVGD